MFAATFPAMQSTAFHSKHEFHVLSRMLFSSQQRSAFAGFLLLLLLLLNFLLDSGLGNVFDDVLTIARQPTEACASAASGVRHPVFIGFAAARLHLSFLFCVSFFRKRSQPVFIKRHHQKGTPPCDLARSLVFCRLSQPGRSCGCGASRSRPQTDC